MILLFYTTHISLTWVKYSVRRQSAQASETSTGLHSLLMSQALTSTHLSESRSCREERSNPRRTRRSKSATYSPCLAMSVARMREDMSLRMRSATAASSTPRRMSVCGRERISRERSLWCRSREESACRDQNSVRAFLW